MYRRSSKVFKMHSSYFGRALPKRRFFFIFVFILVLLILIINNIKIEKEIVVDVDIIGKASIDELNDLNVLTNNYEEEYYQYEKIKNEFKYKKDILYKNIKVIEPNKRIIDTSINKYVILEYTKVFSQTRYCQLFDNTPNPLNDPIQNIYVKECKYKNCIFTCNRKRINEAQAVLFHEYDLVRKIDDEERYMRTALKSRNNNKIWILWNDEPLYVYKYIDKYKFNWTMSYRYDAEISDCSYGCKYKKALNNNNNNNNNDLNKLRIQFQYRKNATLWLVSNCLSVNRTKFAFDLMQYYPTVIDGLCKNVIDFTQSFLISFESLSYKFVYYTYFAYKSIFKAIGLTGSGSKCKRNSVCEVNQLSSYKFYLSFESRNNSYYITEKFWRVLKMGLIPIVIQPSRKFYEDIAPPDSFIHAQDFNYDIKKLANYLRLVSENFDLYAKYFKWKTNYDIVYSAVQTERRRICEMCTRLNMETSSIYYKSVSDWFNNDV